MKPVIGIIMGSDSDLPIMSNAAKMLDDLKIPYELSIVSAHRTPEKLYNYAKTAKDKGLKVIIAGAGGAAHLPGMTAAMTCLPVIGVPVQTKALGGVDSLYSIVQMPPGIPVATMAINGALNAALLAAKIIAITDEELSGRIEAYAEGLETMVESKSDKLEEIKYQAYLDQM
jgi:5-(carboxyamino)imidazole ribonucleotide mutase